MTRPSSCRDCGSYEDDCCDTDRLREECKAARRLLRLFDEHAFVDRHGACAPGVPRHVWDELRRFYRKYGGGTGDEP